ncbi:MAG: hypothetical protein ACRC4M_01135 [Mycoplasma sp.]
MKTKINKIELMATNHKIKDNDIISFSPTANQNDFITIKKQTMENANILPTEIDLSKISVFEDTTFSPIFFLYNREKILNNNYIEDYISLFKTFLGNDINENTIIYSNPNLKKEEGKHYHFITNESSVEPIEELDILLDLSKIDLLNPKEKIKLNKVLNLILVKLNTTTVLSLPNLSNVSFEQKIIDWANNNQIEIDDEDGDSDVNWFLKDFDNEKELAFKDFWNKEILPILSPEEIDKYNLNFLFSTHLDTELAELQKTLEEKVEKYVLEEKYFVPKTIEIYEEKAKRIDAEDIIKYYFVIETFDGEKHWLDEYSGYGLLKCNYEFSFHSFYEPTEKEDQEKIFEIIQNILKNEIKVYPHEMGESYDELGNYEIPKLKSNPIKIYNSHLISNFKPKTKTIKNKNVL